MKLSVAKTQAISLITAIKNHQHMPHSDMLVKDACAKVLIPRYKNIGKGSNIPGLIKNYLIRHFGEVKIGELKPYMVQKTVYELLNSGYAPETIRKRCMIGKTLYKQLIKYQLVNNNPFNDLDLPKVSNIRTDVLTHEQRSPFIQCCRDEDSVYADVLILLLATGLRVSEALNIKSGDINTDFTTLTLPNTKLGVIQHIAINSLARDVLKQRSSLTWNQYLFPSTVNANKPISSPRGCFQRVKARMKVIGHDIDHLHLHDLRRTYASACAEACNGDMHMVASQLRHSSTNMLKRYVHYQPQSIALVSEATAQALINPIHPQHNYEK